MYLTESTFYDIHIANQLNVKKKKKMFRKNSTINLPILRDPFFTLFPPPLGDHPKYMSRPRPPFSFHVVILKYGLNIFCNPKIKKKNEKKIGRS